MNHLIKRYALTLLVAGALGATVLPARGATLRSAPLGQIPLTTPVVTNGLSTLNAEVASLSSYINGEDARFVVTNYDSVTYIPEAYVQLKRSNEWLTVWHESTQLAVITNQLHTLSQAMQTKADIAWGQYDSTTGAAAPDGYTWISSPNVALAGGLAWQKTITTAGTISVLSSNGMVAQNVADTNGYFRIADENGNVQFEIVRGNRRIIGAQADSVVKTDSGLRVAYAVTATSHPTMSFATSLSGPWYAEGAEGAPATSSWSGQSGAYTNEIASTEATLFAYGEYLGGSASYIRNALPTAMSEIVLGGVTYTLGTATIDGHTVLTLEAQ